MVESLQSWPEVIIFLDSENSLCLNIFCDKGEPSPAPLPQSPARCVHVFHPHSTGFKDGRKDELFLPLVDLSTPAERVCGGFVLLAAEKAMGVGAALEIGGEMGIFPSGITRLLVAGPDGATVCLWRQSFSVNWSCKQEYEVFDNTMAKR